jgi:hypothetical protein
LDWWSSPGIKVKSSIFEYILFQDKIMKILEKTFEDILCKYPELIEDGLIFKGRQIIKFGRRIDILFEDKFKRELLVELKSGPIKDEHIGQILSYEGMLLSADDPTIRIMLIGTRVPPNLQKSLDHHGIVWKEITYVKLESFIKTKNDENFLSFFEPQDVDYKSGKNIKEREIFISENMVDPKYFDSNLNTYFMNFKNSDEYKSFKKNTLNDKKEHEEEARLILEKYHGNFNHNHFKEIIKLVDGPYRYERNGKIVATGRWFGNLLITPNTEYFFKTDIKLINDWFNVLRNNNIPIEKRIEILQEDPYKIRGIKTGFITLMLYLLDKTNYSVWFGPLHEGLQKIYPKIGNFNSKGIQYILFNKKAKEFLQQFDFDHTELDWLLWSKGKKMKA